MSTRNHSRLPSHTATAALAAAIAAVVSPLLQSVPADRDVQAVLDTSQPHPRDFVRIQQGTPFVVPSGSILVIKGMSFASNPSANAWWQTIEIDGAAAFSEYGWHVNNAAGMWHDQKVTNIPLGVTASEGETVTATSNRTDCVLLGYLADA